MRIAVGHLASDHALDDAPLADLLRVAVDRLDRRAVTDDGDLVGDLREFVQFVRNDDRGDALRLELDEQPQQRVAVGFVEAGGRLVEDQQLDLLGERLGDLDQLLLADAQIGDEGVRRFLEADFGQEFARAAERHAPVDDAHPGRLVAEEDVFGNRQERHERQLLVNDDDAEMLAVGDARKAPLLALIDNLSLV